MVKQAAARANRRLGHLPPAKADAIEQAWQHGGGQAPALCTYPAGSWGPQEADDLIERDGRKWRRL